MPTEVVMPQMGESITEGTLTKWLKKPGEAVERDEPLFEISTDKVDAEIPSPTAGIMGEIRIQEGATVQINTVVCTINEAGSAPAAAPAKDLKEDSSTPAAEAVAAAEAAIPPPAPEAPAAAGTEIPMPQMGESITEGTITKWLKQVGDKVERDEPLFEISTDKVDAEIPSPIAGTLTEIRVKEGATVTINTIVAVIGGGAAAPAAAKPAASAAPAPAAAAPAATASASVGETPRSSLPAPASAQGPPTQPDQQRQQRAAASAGSRVGQARLRRACSLPQRAPAGGRHSADVRRIGFLGPAPLSLPPTALAGRADQITP